METKYKNRILFFTFHYLDSWGGIEQNIYKISGYLKKDLDISITSPTTDKTNTHYDPDIHYLTSKEVSVDSYDAIFIENFNLLPHLFLICKIIANNLSGKNKPRIFFVPHGGFTLDWSLFSFTQRIVKYSFNNTLGLYFINRYVSKTIAVSDWEKEALKKNGVKTDILVITNGVDVSSLQPLEKENYFVFLGRFDPIKNIEESLLTFKYILTDNRFHDFKFKLIGNFKANQTYYEKLQILIKDNNLHEGVEFLGEKYGTEKDEILSKAKCLFCLSHMENDPIAVKEALWLGTKVLIKPNYGLKDYEKEKNVFSIPGCDFNLGSFFDFCNSKFVFTVVTAFSNWSQIAQDYEKVLNDN